MRINWDSISLDTFAQIDSLLSYNATDKLQQQITALSIITGKSEYHFENISFRRLSKYQKQLISLYENIPTKVSHTFKCKGRTFTFGKEIDEFNGDHLESISLLKLNQSNTAQNCSKIVAILTDEVPHRFLKPLTFKQKIELFDNHLSANIGIPISNKFLTDLGEIAKIYNEQPKKIESLEDGLKPDFETKYTPMFEHWGYFHVFFELSGRDRTKMDYWRKQSIPYIFNSLAHRKDMMDEKDK